MILSSGIPGQLVTGSLTGNDINAVASNSCASAA